MTKSKTDFQMKDIALGLALKQRPKATWKRPTVLRVQLRWRVQGGRTEYHKAFSYVG